MREDEEKIRRRRTRREQEGKKGERVKFTLTLSHDREVTASGNFT